jgi:hypothetical protein
MVETNQSVEDQVASESLVTSGGAHILCRNVIMAENSKMSCGGIPMYISDFDKL